jgi:histidyl-tRNA synthetase
MNSFKTLRRGQEIPVKKKVMENVDDISHFPTLNESLPKLDVEKKIDEVVKPNELDYKALELAKEDECNKYKEPEEVIPDGWIRYTVNKRTKNLEKIEKTELYKQVMEPVATSMTDEKQEENIYEIIDALRANWKRHRKEFIKCYGKDYYNDMFFHTETEYDDEP